MKDVNYFEVLNKILICLIIIIALLALNLLITLTGTSFNDDKEVDSSDTNSVYDVSAFNSVDEQGGLDLFESSEAQVIFFGSPTCGFCVDFIPVLEAAQEEYDLVHNYYDVSAATDTDIVNEMIELMTVESVQDPTLTYGDDFGLTPMVIVVKDGKMISGLLGFVDETTYFDFLEDNGFELK